MGVRAVSIKMKQFFQVKSQVLLCKRMSNLNVLCIVVYQLPKIVKPLRSALQKFKYLIPEISMQHVEII